MSAARLATLVLFARVRRLYRELLAGDAARATLVRHLMLSIRHAHRARLAAVRKRNEARLKLEASELFADVLYDDVCEALEAGPDEDPLEVAARVMQELKALRLRLGVDPQRDQEAG